MFVQRRVLVILSAFTSLRYLSQFKYMTTLDMDEVLVGTNHYGMKDTMNELVSKVGNDFSALSVFDVFYTPIMLTR